VSYTIITNQSQIISIIEREFEINGGIFRLKPTWVARPGIVQPGRRIKLGSEYLAQNLAVNERWLASVTYSDNGIYNDMCPEDHGYSYIIVPEGLIKLKDAIDNCRELMLGSKGRKWDVLPKFFDNWNRIPFHMHPCQEHVSEGLLGKPESYHFPVELNINRNASPATPVGVDPTYSDKQIMDYLSAYFKGDNRLTDIGNTVNILPGTGYFMPPCTLHAPGSLVTYELQAASDVSCIPESRVNDMPMPPDMVDRDLPVKIDKDGFDKVCEYMLDMIKCKNAGNMENFREEYFRPPITVRKEDEGEQKLVIYRCGKASEASNPDIYSSKRTEVKAKSEWNLTETSAFGAIVLRGHGTLSANGKSPLEIESASLFESRDDSFADEFFVSAEAAKNLTVKANSHEPLAFYQHFAGGSNPEASTIKVPEYDFFQRRPTMESQAPNNKKAYVKYGNGSSG